MWDDPLHPVTATPAISDDLWRRVDASIAQRSERMVRFRRRIHATPEASGEELATTALVAETLREHDLEPRVMAGEIGVIADLDLGAAGGTFVALRAELDCVAVNDDKQVPYASTRPGLCHACGHDAHTTMVLGAAIALAEHRATLAGAGFRHNLRFILQPAEESGTGARSMIQQGAIDGVEAIIALHVDPFIDAGTIGVRRGPLTSACKAFRARVHGRSGHSARPHQAIDPIPAAINLVSLFYQLCPRSIDSRSPLALTVASISAGSAFNAIPDEAVICGTLRTTAVEEMQVVQRRMEAIAQSMAGATGAVVELEFMHSTPPTNNDPAIIATLASSVRAVLGPERLTWIEQPSLGAEDFGFYQELIAGAIVRLGTAAPGERQHTPLHSSLFDIDETALPAGTRVLARCGLELAMRAEGV